MNRIFILPVLWNPGATPEKSEEKNMVFLQERIGKLIDELGSLICTQHREIGTYRMLHTDERFEDIAHLDTSSWKEFHSSEIWGGHRDYYWFETTVTIPEELDGQCVVYSVTTGREAEWDATNPQFTIYVNGEQVQGLDVNHRDVILTEKAKSGARYRIVLSAFTGDSNFSLLLKTTICALDRKTEKYYYDLFVPYRVACMLSPESQEYIQIITSLNESLNLLDLRKPFSEEYYRTLELAQRQLTAQFYGKLCGHNSPKVRCVGHTHIDVAWMWTLAVTEDKAVRSFSTVLELMDRYPEYIFMSSQPQLYKYVKKNAPKVYEKIKERVKEGRWEPEGGMFVEADCNLSSGESLVRQVLHGKRFFRQEFGKDNEILWLPDVFGYSAALPQIMKKSGLNYFMTTKISWNEFNKMPYDTFEWEGIDGTKVLTHFIPTRDFNAEVVAGATETEHFTTYNGDLTPSQVKGGWQRYQQKHLGDEVLMCYGYGDGGGGPTSRMLEEQRRLNQGIPGCPKTEPSTVADFFHDLDRQVSGSKYLPTWSGELYLEYHRGTYTSMARNKKYNRKAEFAYENAELFSSMNSLLGHTVYPKQKINDGWEVIMRNQFHDILPGSSIKEVYDDSKAEYEKILPAAGQMTATALEQITASVDAPKGSLIVFNPNSSSCPVLVEFDLPEGMEHPMIYGDGYSVACQKDGAKAMFVAENLPPKGYRTYRLCDGATDVPAGGMTVTPQRLENNFFSIALNEKGQFTSVYDKSAGREVLQNGKAGNVLMSYEDKPHNWDAWDVNNYYVEKAWEVDDLLSAEVEENGPVRSCLKLTYRYLDSTIIERIYLYSGIARIDLAFEIDWNEHQVFLRTLFPVDVHSTEATFEIQYGNVKRPTHKNTSWDFAKFETCHHKWLDFSEDDYGVSMLNDCKYGCDVHDSVIGISLLKSALYPNPDADKEHHEFTLSLYPHQGGWKTARTVDQAYSLNNPAVAVVKTNEGGMLPSTLSLVSCPQENVVIEVVKQAEDGDDTIVRLYECFNRRTKASISFGFPVAAVTECDLLEQDVAPVDYDGSTASFEIKPYEIKTFRLRSKPVTKN